MVAAEKIWLRFLPLLARIQITTPTSQLGFQADIIMKVNQLCVHSSPRRERRLPTAAHRLDLQQKQKGAMFVHLQQKLPVATGNVGSDYGQHGACGLGTVTLEVPAMVIILGLKRHMACYLSCTGPACAKNSP